MRFILFTVLLDMVAIGIMVPVLPHIVGQFTTNNDGQALAFLWVTLAFGAANFVGSPIMGALSDRFGRRPVLLLGFSGMALSFFVTASATALWMLIAVRLVSGFFQSNVAVANAYVADITAAADRAKRFGLLGAMFGVGFILGPVVGGLLGSVDLRWPFWVAGSLALLNAAYGLWVLPESLPVERRRAFDWRRANPIAALQGLAKLRGVGPLVVVIALSGLAQFILHMTWVLYTKFKLGWGPREVGLSLFAVGVVAVVSQGFLLKHYLKRWTPSTLAIISLSASVPYFIILGLVTQTWMFYVAFLMGLITGASQSAMQSIVSNAADERTQGEALGAVSSINSLMAVIAPVVGIELLRAVAHRPAGDWQLGLPYFVCAALAALAALLAHRFFKQHAMLAPAPGQAAASMEPTIDAGVAKAP
jgi:MFS transporter, DHA1 family, tetracycline resistance protein